MVANVESMFSVREKPWHGLGQIVAEAPTSKDALIYAGLDWNVVQKPMYFPKSKEEGKTTFNKIPNHVVNVRETDGQVLGVVTEQYQIVQNQEAFAWVDELLKEGEVRYETAGSLANGQRVWLMAKMPEIDIVGDKTEPYLVFTNSHNGKGAIQVCLTPIRVVCQNTLNFALNGAERKWSAIHVGSLEDKLEQAKLTLGFAHSYLNELAGHADVLAQKNMSDDSIKQFIEELFPVDETEATVRQINNVYSIREELEARIKNAPDLKKFQNTAWQVINGVSDYVTHAEPKRNTETYKENMFSKVITGHPVIDKAHSLLLKVA